MSSNESYLSGSEQKLYSFNQAREEANSRLGMSLSLETFGELMGLSSVRPAFVTAAEKASGLYSDANITQFCEELRNPETPVKMKKKGRPGKDEKTMTAAQWQEYMELKAAAEAAKKAAAEAEAAAAEIKSAAE